MAITLKTYSPGESFILRDRTHVRGKGSGDPSRMLQGELDLSPGTLG